MARGRTARQAQAEGRDEAFLKEIDRSATLPAGTTTGNAAGAVFCALLGRVGAGEARDVVESMPPSLRPLIVRCARHRDEPAEVFDRPEFLRRVGEHLRLSPAEAECVAAAVFSAMNAWLPRSQLDDVESQLPADLKTLWRTGLERRIA